MPSDLLKLPPLDQVRGFVAVARRLSISRAAEDLCVTQSAVSKQVRILEEHLGTRLLARRHRAVELTRDGERFFRHMETCFRQMLDAAEMVRGSRERRAVTITTTIGVASLWLLPRLTRFQRQHPDVDVRVAADNKIVDVSAEGVELAIRYCPLDRAPPGATRLFGEVIAPVAHPSLAREGLDSAEALARFTLLEYDDAGRPWLRWADWLNAAGLANHSPKSVLHYNQYDQVIQAAIAGQGIALGRLALVRPMVDEGRLAIVRTGGDARASDYAYWLIRGERLSEPAGRFASWVESEAARSSADLAADAVSGSSTPGAVTV